MPTPLNSRELKQSSALAAHTIKVDSNGHVLLKLNILVSRLLRVLIEKCFLYWPTIEPSSRVTMEDLSLLFSAYFSSSKVNVLSSAYNVFLAWIATRVAPWAWLRPISCHGSSRFGGARGAGGA